MFKIAFYYNLELFSHNNEFQPITSIFYLCLHFFKSYHPILYNLFSNHCVIFLDRPGPSHASMLFRHYNSIVPSR